LSYSPTVRKELQLSESLAQSQPVFPLVCAGGSVA